MVPQPPDVGFSTRKTRTVNTGLLACADTDDGAVVCVRDGVGLCILECQCGKYEVGQCRFREL